MSSTRLRERYALSNLLYAIRSLRAFVRETERALSKVQFRRRYGPGMNVMDLDNLVVLDGCQFDHFAEYNTIDGELHWIVSQGTHSREFIEGIDGDVFFRVCYTDVLDCRDESLRTVPPSAVVDLTVEMHEQDWFGVCNPSKGDLDVPDAAQPGQQLEDQTRTSRVGALGRVEEDCAV
ncbi:hypothetical protein [Halapricum desulfuricans]|uniref:Arylsulfatase A or related enzyme n=1 Tax=Halapricum desulfuricans TaxID=2841257 RepID=A0A897NT54_9EURY|nr:hypothetical protein [Halapricum desulfuricans]QSG16042.1 Arylsulfatase A or related enzyme [Halapricum desulfuricans]